MMRRVFRGFSSKVTRWALLVALSVAVIVPRGADTAFASEAKSLTVKGAFARATIGKGRVGAAYLEIHNASSTKDRLVGASTEAAKRAELHTHLHEAGVMKMRPIEGIDVPAHGMAALKPGGDHVMLMGLSAPLREGSHFPLILTFEKAGDIFVMVMVGGVGASKAGHAGNTSHTGHKKKHKHGD